MNEYEIRRADNAPGKAAEGRVAGWHPASGDVRPDVRFRAAWSAARLFVRFDVRGDRGVRSVVEAPQGPVWTDSCVECFLQPSGAEGHFNFEANAGGTLHFSYILDPRRLPEGGYARWVLPPPAACARVAVRASLPRRVEPALPGPVDWSVEMEIPFALLSDLAGVPCAPKSGDVWRGNFFHCGDAAPHPRWGAWCDVGEKLDFHQPDRFGALVFA